MEIKSEFDLIEKIKERVLSTGPAVPKNLVMGIGDDAAVYEIGGGRYGIFTTDISIESVHFIVGISTPYDIGYKAMTGNISDIAAMCGRPRLAFISLGIPSGRQEEEIMSGYDGLIDASKLSGTVIAGGDISRSSELIVNIAVYGEADVMPVLRSTAKEGDKIYLTGTTGGSLAGLEILKSGNKKLITEFRSLVDRHRRPNSRIDLIDTIKEYKPTAMVDISDGLLSDLGHICGQSGRGFLLYRDKIPVSGDLQKYSLLKKRDPYKYVFESGEEYELIFTSREIHDPGKGDITCIGEITKEGFLLETGEGMEKINLKGFDHFEK